MSNLKAIAVDIDGTITDENRKICISAIEAIRAAESLEIPTIIVTGNIFHYAYATAVLLGTDRSVVAENGGVISELHNGNQRIKVLGDFKKVNKAYEFLKSQITNKYDDKYKLNKVSDSDDRLSEIAIYRTINENIIKEELKDFDVEIYDTQFAIHITDNKVNKGSSLEIVAKEQGFNMDEILAIGDSENDIEFLADAGFKVAVANADSNLKAIADYVATKKYGDGVKEAIEKFIL